MHLPHSHSGAFLPCFGSNDTNWEKKMSFWADHMVKVNTFFKKNKNKIVF